MDSLSKKYSLTFPRFESKEARLKRYKKAKDTIFLSCLSLPGDDLLSQDPAVQVPSALESLTSVFGMGTGVTSPSLSPDLMKMFYTLKTAQYLSLSICLN